MQLCLCILLLWLCFYCGPEQLNNNGRGVKTPFCWKLHYLCTLLLWKRLKIFSELKRCGTEGTASKYWNRFASACFFPLVFVHFWYPLLCLFKFIFICYSSHLKYLCSGSPSSPLPPFFLFKNMFFFKFICLMSILCNVYSMPLSNFPPYRQPCEVGWLEWEAWKWTEGD